jgi:heat shock protein HslJ
VGLSEASLPALAGRQFQGAGPVAPVRFRLEADGTLQASYGCNSGEGTATIINGRLVVSGLSRTAMGCDPALMQQDDAIVAMLLAGPTITIEGATLVLTNRKLTLRLDEQFAVALVGTRWMTNGYFTPQVAGFSGLRQGLVLRTDATWSYAGCTATATGRYVVTGDAIAFTMTSPVPPSCGSNPSQATEEQNLIGLLQGTATYQITERALRLSGPDGNGEMFLAN